MRTPSPAQASVLVGVESKPLYLDPTGVGSAQRLDPAKPTGGSGSQFNETLPKDGSTHDFDLDPVLARPLDRKSTRLNSSHSQISYAVFCLKKKTMQHYHTTHIWYFLS